MKLFLGAYSWCWCLINRWESEWLGYKTSSLYRECQCSSWSPPVRCRGDWPYSTCYSRQSTVCCGSWWTQSAYVERQAFVHRFISFKSASACIRPCWLELVEFRQHWRFVVVVVVVVSLGELFLHVGSSSATSTAYAAPCSAPCSTSAEHV